MSERTDTLIDELVEAEGDVIVTYESNYDAEPAERKLRDARDALKAEIERMERVVDAAIAYHVVNKDMHIDLNDPMAIPEMQRRFVECDENLHAAVREYQEQERKE